MDNNNKILFNRDRLLEISQRKAELLQSVIEHYDHIESNSIFADEIQDVYQELMDEETEIVYEKEKTIECPGCGFECLQIHTYCLACGMRLPDAYGNSLI